MREIIQTRVCMATRSKTVFVLVRSEQVLWREGTTGSAVLCRLTSTGSAGFSREQAQGHSQRSRYKPHSGSRRGGLRPGDLGCNHAKLCWRLKAS